MAALSWDEICKRAEDNNKTVLCEVEKRGEKRFFLVKCNTCNEEKESSIKEIARCSGCNLSSQRINSNIQFLNNSKQIHGDKYNYDLVEYINSFTNVIIKCNSCNNIFEQRPFNHIRGNGCNICSKNKKLDTDKFILRSSKIHGDKYNYDLVAYVNSISKVQIKCNDCKSVFFQEAADHMRGRGCKICFFNKNKRTLSDFISLAYQIHGDKYNYDLVEYVNKRTKIKIFCNSCNLVFEQRPGCHLNGKGCGICAINNLRGDKNSFIYKAYQIHGNKYNYDLVEYINSISKVQIKCNDCYKIFDQRPACHLAGHGCNVCAIKLVTDKHRSNKEEFIIKANQKHGDKYNYDLVEYVNSISKVQIKCNKCNNIFVQKGSNHLSGAGCPKCNESKGENRVAKYLTDNNIKFAKNKIFKTLKDKSYLKPDFYLSDLNLLTEYDGEGHYFPVFGTTPEDKQKNFEDCQRRDKIKNEWAKANNIPLLRIPYWDFDRIEELVGEFIFEHTRKREMKQLVLEI